MNKPIKIVQSSSPHTGSTLLLNLIHGVLRPEEEIHYPTEKYVNNYLITKTHNTNIDHWINKYPEYELYFIVSHRKNHKKIDNKYHKYKNVLIIDYDNINETPDNTLIDISKFISTKLKEFLPECVYPTISDEEIHNDIINRITSMNKLYNEILKNKNFSYWDKFYGIHGSHRNRNK
jgi:hypothetical protein